MLSILFAICMISIFIKIGLFALRAAWGIGKILLTIIFAPLVLIAMAASGLFTIAFGFLIVIGIISLFACHLS